MDWILGLLEASVAVYLFVALYVGIFRRTGGAEYGPLTVLLVVLAAFTSLHVIALRQGATPTAETHGTVMLLAATALVVHFAGCYTKLPQPRRGVWLRAGYGGAIFGALLEGANLLHGTTPLVGHELGVVAWPLTALGALVHAAVIGALGASTWLLARAFLDGLKEALGATIGGAALTGAVTFDALQGMGAFHLRGIGQVGLFVFVTGVTTSLVVRYMSLERELHVRTTELETLTAQLRRSNSDLRATQEELVRKEQLAAVGELAAVVAHEVRNPLAVIANAVAGLRKATLSNEDRTTLLGILDEETRRLNRLVSDLLRYARPINVQKSRVALADLLDRPLQLAKKQNIEVKSKGGEGVRVWGDASLLRQVFDNLIDNAVQAMGYGGTLTVDVEPKREDGFDGWAIHVVDTGEGMDTLVRNRAKDPFFTTRPAGTGLGLAIVDRIVDAHGGHLLITSRPGEGTTVTVCLPSAPPGESSSSEIRAVGSAMQEKKKQA